MNKRIAHMSTSEMDRATALVRERIDTASTDTLNLLELIVGKNNLMSITFLDLALRGAGKPGERRRLTRFATDAL